MKIKDRLLKLFGLKKEDYAKSGEQKTNIFYPLLFWMSLDNFQQELFRKPLTRKDRFTEYDIMDLENGDIGFALDLYAEECLRPIDKEGNYFVIKSNDPQVIKELNKFIKKFGIMEKLFAFTRALAKYGEIFLYLNEDKNENIKSIVPIHPAIVDPVYVDENDATANVGKFIGWSCPTLSQVLNSPQDYIFPPFVLVQFRIADYGSLDMSGKSMLANAVKNWRMLDMLEVMTQIFKMNRSIEKRLYKIDVGNADIVEAMNIVEEYEKHLKQIAMARQINGEWLKTQKPNDFLQEIFFPMRSGSNSSVEIFPAPGGISDVVDLEYFRDKLRTSLGIPVDYFNEKSGGSWDKGKYLSYQDMRFARRVSRLQLSLKKGLYKLFKIYLTRLGITSKFKIEFENMSIFESKMKAEVLKDILDLVKSLVDLGNDFGWDKKTWVEWVTDTYLDIPPEIHKKLIASMEQQSTEGEEIGGMSSEEEYGRRMGKGAEGMESEEQPPEEETEEVGSEEEEQPEEGEEEEEYPEEEGEEEEEQPEEGGEEVSNRREDIEKSMKEIYQVVQQELFSRLGNNKKKK